jgi:hypothetical protein
VIKLVLILAGLSLLAYSTPSARASSTANSATGPVSYNPSVEVLQAPYPEATFRGSVTVTVCPPEALKTAPAFT